MRQCADRWRATATSSWTTGFARRSGRRGHRAELGQREVRARRAQRPRRAGCRAVDREEACCAPISAPGAGTARVYRPAHARALLLLVVSMASTGPALLLPAVSVASTGCVSVASTGCVSMLSTGCESMHSTGCESMLSTGFIPPAIQHRPHQPERLLSQARQRGTSTANHNHGVPVRTRPAMRLAARPRP